LLPLRSVFAKVCICTVYDAAGLAKSAHSTWWSIPGISWSTIATPRSRTTRSRNFTSVPRPQERADQADQCYHQKTPSHRRKPVPIAEMGPGLRREVEGGRRGIELSECVRALVSWSGTFFVRAAVPSEAW